MKCNVLSYNLNRGRALPKLPLLIEEFKPDILVLQEIDTLDDSVTSIEEFGYTLADFSHSFARRNSLFGVATYYKNGAFSMKKSHTIILPYGLKEIVDFVLIRTFQKRTVLKTDLETPEGKTLIVYNVHLSAFTSNNLRMKQIRRTFETLDTSSDAMIVLGDFNYPYGRKKFEEEFAKYGFQEATHKIFDTFRSTMKIFPFKLKLDYVMYRNMEHVISQKIPARYSDHFPLLTSCEF